MSLFGSSRKQSTTATTYNTSIGVEGNTGATVAGSNNVTTFTDLGAIQAGLDVAMATAEAQRDSVADVLGVARDAIGAGVGFGRMAWEAAGTVLDGYRGITQMGLDTAAGAINTAQRGDAGEVSKLATYGFLALAAIVLLPGLVKRG